MLVKLKRKTRVKLALCFVLGLSVLLFAGLILAEKKTKQICFGDDQPCFSVDIEEGKKCYVNINLLGINKHINISENYVRIYYILKKFKIINFNFSKVFDVIFQL